MQLIDGYLTRYSVTACFTAFPLFRLKTAMHWSGLTNPVEMNGSKNFLKLIILAVKGNFSQNAILFNAANSMAAVTVRRSRQ